MSLIKIEEKERKTNHPIICRKAKDRTTLEAPVTDNRYDHHDFNVQVVKDYFK